MLGFQDEASFGRISEPAYCWSPPKERPCVPSQRIRQYKPAYGTVFPETGESFFMVLEKCNTENMAIYLKALSEQFPDDLILLCVDRASYHTTKKLPIPSNIKLFFLLPRTPQMNPMEIVWREIRKRGFKNRIFKSMGEVIARFYEVVESLTNEALQSVSLWGWVRNIVELF